MLNMLNILKFPKTALFGFLALVASAIAPIQPAQAQTQLNLDQFTPALSTLNGTERFYARETGVSGTTAPDVVLPIASLVTYIKAQGLVTSFSATLSTPLAGILTSSVSTPTTTPALALGLVSQSANCVIAGPSSGSATAPTCRALIAADLPAAVAYISSANIFSATQSTTVKTLSGTGTVTMTWGASSGNIFDFPLTGSVTLLANPTGTVAGTCALLEIDQPATGGPYVISSYGSAYYFPGGTAPTLSTGASAVDVLNMCGTASGKILVTSALNFKT